jgi:hypothetical protein
MAFPTVGLFARYEAKDESGYTAGDPVETIVDQSGNARPLSQATVAKRPTWHPSVVNGNAVFRFDGVDDLSLGSYLSGEPMTAWTITVVVSSDPGEATSRKWPFAVDSGSASRIFAFTEGVTSSEWGSFVRSTTGTVQQSTSGVDTTVWTVLTLVWDGTVTSLFRNGTQVETSAALAGSIHTSSIGMAAIAALQSECMSGDVALAAAWRNTAMGASARADLHTYVQDTYGIAVSDYVSSGVTGTVGVTEAPDTLVASGTVVAPSVSGAAALQEPPDAFAAAGTFTPPAANDPADLTLTQQGPDVLLEWPAPVMAGATHAAVFRRAGTDTSPFVPSPQAELARVPVGQTSWTDVNPGTGDWTYQVFPVEEGT